MTDEEYLQKLEATLKSIPGWLNVILLLDEIQKVKIRISEKFLEKQ